MDIFEKIEKERKRMQRENNKRMKDFVTKKMNVIMNMKYILEEYQGKKLSNVFIKNNHYKIDLDEITKHIDDLIVINSNVTTNNEISESQRTFSKNNYELNLLLTLEEKNDFIEWFKEFEYKFNNLDELQRKLLYYTLIEKENNVWLSLNTNYSERTIANLKNKAINELYRQLKLGKLTSKEFLKFNTINK